MKTSVNLLDSLVSEIRDWNKVNLWQREYTIFVLGRSQDEMNESEEEK